MIEQLFKQFLRLTPDPVAASNLVIAQVLYSHDAAMTAEQAASKLGISKDKVYELCRTGTLGHRKIGRTVRIYPADLESFEGDSKAEPIQGLRHLKVA